ncbi:EmrB/QacA subfamily drug resistance transporter [Saccharothrix variisporea]|uniref:EmrB/QacA subfamily drug resistance transporter n=2 Tax=Saccharothrix variisporea TaxID=543527 RepID=A0A495WYR8_9PSEU|nr:EmrB/QacA subfamily drug resistance transporter [Saccharothrix variisporea]
MDTAQRWALGLASAASFIVALDVLVVATALTSIQRDLDAGLGTLEWTLNAYSLAFAVLLPTGAALGDRFGRKRVLVVGLALFAVSSAACALAPGVGVLVAARAFQGAGAALVLPLALTIVSTAFPPRSRGKALGLFSGITGIATFAGPFVGGVVAEGLAWQWVFWVNVPICAVVIRLVGRHVADGRGPVRPLDPWGVLLVTAGVFGLVWGLVRADAVGWAGVEVLASLVVGLVLVAVFVRHEQRTPAPMMPMRFFAIRAFTSANVANFALYASLYGTLFLLAQHFREVLGHGPLAAGLRLMPWTGTLMVCAPIAGVLADRWGERRLMVVGLLLQGVGMAWLASVSGPDVGYAQMLPPLVVGGVGVSMAMPAAQKSVVGAVGPAEVGQASGVLTVLRILGGVFGIAVLGAVFGAFGGVGSPAAFTAGFGPAIGVAAAFALLGCVVALGMPGRRAAVVAGEPRVD